MQLFLPGGSGSSTAPRTALRHLGLQQVSVQLNLAAVPNLMSLDLSYLPQPLNALDLRAVPQLTSLRAERVGLQALDVSPVWDRLVRLNVTRNHMRVLDVSGATVLQELLCAECWQLHTINLPPLAPALQTLQADYCKWLRELDVTKCGGLRDLSLCATGITEVDLSAATDLTSLALEQCDVCDLDLSHCTSLEDLSLAWVPLKELHLGACQQLRVVQVGKSVRLAGVHPGAQVTADDDW